MRAPEGPGGGDPASPEVATEAQALRSSVKVAINAVLITDFAVPLACAGLNGSVFIPDVSGNTHGTTICELGLSLELCQPAVRVHRHLHPAALTRITWLRAFPCFA